jgi:hypothetical protein
MSLTPCSIEVPRSQTPSKSAVAEGNSNRALSLIKMDYCKKVVALLVILTFFAIQASMAQQQSEICVNVSGKIPGDGRALVASKNFAGTGFKLVDVVSSSTHSIGFLSIYDQASISGKYFYNVVQSSWHCGVVV